MGSWRATRSCPSTRGATRSRGETTIARTFTFAPITGPTYTLRYETTREVGSGCGSAGYTDDVSTVTIR
jgi:hypothetical protein